MSEESIYCFIDLMDNVTRANHSIAFIYSGVTVKKVETKLLDSGILFVPAVFNIPISYPLRLSESGWKVGLSSISIPDTQLNLAKLTNNVVHDAVIVMTFVFKTARWDGVTVQCFCLAIGGT